MLQSITDKKILKLNDAEKTELERWCNEKDYELTLNVGQMIEFIQDKRPTLKGIARDRFGKWFVTIDNAQFGHKDQLIDALWETATRILKTESGQK